MLLAALLLLPPLSEGSEGTDLVPVVVHEWGTFTTVFGPSGQPIRWRPLLADGDLPGFVYELGDQHNLPTDIQIVNKASIEALVRMETPVIYFYADNVEPVSFELSVRYSDGWLTEWFPRADVPDPGTLRWEATLLPQAASVALPHDGHESHYYAARDVASNPVMDQRTNEVDRFLFYRGVGNAEPDVLVSEVDETVWIHSHAPRGTAIFFESDGDAACWGALTLSTPTQAAPETVCGDPVGLEAMLMSVLVGEGLYADEAAAMVATWRGHWFEPGTRVISIVPQEQTDALLPLSMSFEPAERVRVMVERSELIRRADVRQLAALVQDGASASDLNQRFGRFADPGLRIAVDMGLLPAGTASELHAAL